MVNEIDDDYQGRMDACKRPVSSAIISNESHSRLT